MTFQNIHELTRYLIYLFISQVEIFCNELCESSEKLKCYLTLSIVSPRFH